MRAWNIGDTCYQGRVMGKVTGLVWPGPEPVDGVVDLSTEWAQRPNSEAIACLVIFRGHRGPVRVAVGELARYMAMPCRVTTKAG